MTFWLNHGEVNLLFKHLLLQKIGLFKYFFNSIFLDILKKIKL